MALQSITAHRIDYSNGRPVIRPGLLHDHLNEPYRTSSSRIIFVESRNHYASCDDCKRHLKQFWFWSEEFFRQACVDSNGYVRELDVNQTPDGAKTIKYLRCLIKQVTVVDEDENKVDLDYKWYELGISIRQNQNGTVAVIIYGVPPTFHTTFSETLLKVATDSHWQNDGERVTATIMQEVVRLYDESIWAISKAIRRVEKSRGNLDKYTFNWQHELLRHTIHTSEVLEVAVSSFREMSQVTTTGAGQHNLIGSSDRAREQYDFYCRLLDNFRLRSRANDARLKNEIDLALNLVTQKDSKETLVISNAALKDSQAMKVISIVTLLFLPATFVASIFGMAFFNNSKTDGFIVSGWIWLFWVISAVLTVIAIGFYFYGRRMINKVNEKRKKGPANAVQSGHNV